MGCKYAWTWIHFSVNFFHHSAMGWESTWLHWFLQRCTICKKVAEWRWVQNASCFAPCFYNTDGQPAVNFDSHYPHEMLRNWNGLLARSVPWNYSSLGSVLDLTTGRHWHRAVGKFERLHQPRPPLGYVYVQFMFFAQKDTDHFPGSKPYMARFSIPSQTPKGVSVSVDNPNYPSSWFHCFFFLGKVTRPIHITLYSRRCRIVAPRTFISCTLW